MVPNFRDANEHSFEEFLCTCTIRSCCPLAFLPCSPFSIVLKDACISLPFLSFLLLGVQRILSSGPNFDFGNFYIFFFPPCLKKCLQNVLP